MRSYAGEHLKGYKAFEDMILLIDPDISPDWITSSLEKVNQDRRLSGAAMVSVAAARFQKVKSKALMQQQFHDHSQKTMAMFGRKGSQTLDQHGRLIYTRLSEGTPVGTAKLREMTMIFDKMCIEQKRLDEKRHMEEYQAGSREDPFDESAWIPEVGHEAFSCLCLFIS